MQNLFKTKSMAALQAEGEESSTQSLLAHNGIPLKRTLSAWSLMGLGIGNVIGAGIFVLTGQAAATHAGPAIILSFVIAAIASAFAGLCYAEMASTVPVSGSAYTYAYATLGELVAWIIGWDLVLEYALGAVTVAIGWSGYVSSLLGDFGLQLPAALSSAPFDYDTVTGAWHRTAAIVNLPAVLITAVSAALLVIGIRESAKVNNFMVAVKIAIVVIFIVACIGFVNTANWVTASNPDGALIPPSQGSGLYGWSGILRGAGVVFFAYIGFDSVSTAAQEARNPQRDMPIGILGSLVICTILYVLVAFVITGIVPYDKLDVPDPIAVGVDAVGLKWLAPLVKLGAVLGLSSVILVSLLGQTRVVYSMARDGLLPEICSAVHPRLQTPHVTTIITGIICSVLAGLLPIDLVGELVSIGTLLAFAIVCMGVIVLRVVQPRLERPFRTPFVWFVAPAGVASSVFLMFGLPFDTWSRLAVWLVIGLAIYFLYGARHSHLKKTAVADQS